MKRFPAGRVVDRAGRKAGFTMDDTIAAIATPMGEGGLAVLRISGPDALRVGDAVFHPRGKHSLRPSEAPSHTMHFGHVVVEGREVDEVMVAVMRAPRTFTREDVVEISCHGGILVVRAVLDAVLTHGTRLAEPGEFTRRAFLNGRIDLAQAEAIVDVIHAQTELALKAANQQLAGNLSRKIDRLRDDLMHVLAHVEAYIDFPEEDILPDTREQLGRRLVDARDFIAGLLVTAREGRVLRRGVRAAIVGSPNAGKSSLLNQLLGEERAIVSTVPGTTRDTIEAIANIRGLPILFIDTAGLREAGDEIEQEGIRRSLDSLDRAELILHILDLNTPLTAMDREYLDALQDRTRIVIGNKSDLPRHLEPLAVSAGLLEVSCLTGQGLEALKDRIRELFWTGAVRADMVEAMINSRHQDALQRAEKALLQTIEAMNQELSLELVAVDLRTAVNAVGEIVGKTTTEDLLDSIFSQFCIGK